MNHLEVLKEIRAFYKRTSKENPYCLALDYAIEVLEKEEEYEYYENLPCQCDTCRLHNLGSGSSVIGKGDGTAEKPAKEKHINCDCPSFWKKRHDICIPEVFPKEKELNSIGKVAEDILYSKEKDEETYECPRESGKECWACNQRDKPPFQKISALPITLNDSIYAYKIREIIEVVNTLSAEIEKIISN